MRTFPRLFLSALVGSSILASAVADVVTLKGGEKVEGKITAESDAEVTIESKVGGILDSRTVKRSEIESISKEEPDAVAWAPLSKVALGNNSLPSATQYDNFINPLKNFVTQFPSSKHKAAAEKLASDFEAEKKRVSDGEVKLSGKWLSKAEVERERYQVSGAVAANYMKEQAARGDTIGALNTFDIIEKQYPNSRGYIDAVEVARKLYAPLKQQVDARMVRLPEENKEREKAVAGATGTNKMQLRDELQREKDAIKAALLQSRAQKLKYPPLILRSEEALKEIAQNIQQDVPRLAGIDTAKARKSFDMTDQAQASLEKKELMAADEAVKKARELWDRNEVVNRVDKQIAEARAAASALTETITETAAATPAPAPKPAEVPKTETPETPAEEAGAPEDEPASPVGRIILLVVITVGALVGFKVYKAKQKKDSEGEE